MIREKRFSSWKGIPRRKGSAMRSLGLFLIGLSFLLFPAVGEGEGNALSPDPADMEHLERGEVAIKTVGGEGGGTERVQATILIAAPAERVWQIMNDCDHSPEFVPGLKSCRVLRREGQDEIIEHSMKFSWLLPEVTYVFRARYEQNRQVAFQRIAGDVRRFEGNWTLQPVDGERKTIVVYSLYLDPGFLVPQWMVRLLLREDLPAVLFSLRDRTLDSKRKDLAGK